MGVYIFCLGQYTWDKNISIPIEIIQATIDFCGFGVFLGRKIEMDNVADSKNIKNN
jgi:hypothetical protein